MKTLYILVVLLGLQACAGPGLNEALQQCPNPGMDVRNPDFHQHYSKHQTDPFFDCLIANIPQPYGFSQAMAASTIEGRLLFHSPNVQDAKTMLAEKFLWNAVEDREINGDGAQKFWTIAMVKLKQDDGNAMARALSNSMGLYSAANANNTAVMNANKPITCMGMGPNMVSCQ